MSLDPKSPSLSKVPVGHGDNSARDSIALALALEFYRGEYREKTSNPLWLKNYTAGITVGSVESLKYAEEEAQRCASMFWIYWKPDADKFHQDKPL